MDTTNKASGMIQGYVATIGMFDGVHKGHQFVLRQVVEQSRRCGLQSLCVTFDRSPRQEQVLTPLDEKLQLIRQTGIDRIEVLSFTSELKSLSAKTFMEQVLKQQLGVKMLLTGYDNRFGHNRMEGFADYVHYGQELGIEVSALPAEGSISSSMVRQLLADGQVEEASQCLGRPYRVTAHVTHGEHIGTLLGYPTANLVPDDPSQLIPARGVYAVRCGSLKGMMNIGKRPTFGSHPLTIEVHLLDYSGNLYDRQLTVEFVSRLREEQDFESAELLKEQLKKDLLETRQRL